MISLAYRLNPTLPLALAGALLTAHGADLAAWVAHRFFYQGVPHYLLGTLAIILILLGGVSIAPLPLATALVKLQAAVARAARRHEPPQTASRRYPSHHPRRRRSRRSHPAPEGAAQGLVIVFTVLLATAAYYLGVGDANTVNKLAQWAYYALAGAVLTLLADMAIHRRP
jgi:dolichol-phosphate mannosyltransferase